MLVRFSEMIMPSFDSNDHKFLLTPYKEVNIQKKTLRDILNENHFNGQNLNELNCSLRINHKRKQTNWDVLFVDAVSEVIADECKNELDSPLKVTIALRHRKTPHYHKNLKLNVRVRPCFQTSCMQCHELTISVSLEYDSVRHLEQAIYDTLPCIPTWAVMIGFKGQQLNGTYLNRNIPLWWFGLAYGSVVSLHNHKPDIKCSQQNSPKTVARSSSHRGILKNSSTLRLKESSFTSLVHAKESEENFKSFDCNKKSII
jgi:hypothetical protein